MERSTKCPCLYSALTPICRADTEALRVPRVEDLNHFCLSGQHRRCELFRAFLMTLAVRPEGWAAAPVGPTAQLRQDTPQAAPAARGSEK